MNKVLEGKDWKEVTFLPGYKEKYCNEKYFEKYRFLGDDDLSAFNLGVYRTKQNDDEELLWATKYVGVVPLLSRDDEKEKTDSYIAISSRFDKLSPTKMISKVLSGMDYYEYPERIKIKNYSANEWHKLKDKSGDDGILFGTVDGIGDIDLSSPTGNDNDLNNSSLAGIVDTFGVFEIIDFVNLAKQTCKKTLKKQSNRIEENLNCKVKGRILVQKQIKYNEARGQVHRVYCAYNTLSENIKENQIMKYALYLCLNHSGIGESLREDIQYCMNCLSGVTLKKCSSSDFIGIKNNGAFRQYKEVMEAAKKVINRYFVGDSNSDNNNEGKKASSKVQNFKVKPYFIDMNLLFELYCRAIIREGIEKFNNDKNVHDNKIKLILESAKIGKKNLFENGRSAYFMSEYIPDLVINYELDGVDSGVLAVLDAKNSDVKKQTDKKRERTHQVMFYMQALQCKYGGLISQVESDSKTENNSNPIYSHKDLLNNAGKLFYIPVTDENNDDDGNIISYLKDITDYNNNFSGIISLYKAKNRDKDLDEIYGDAVYTSKGFNKDTSEKLVDALGWNKDELIKRGEK